MTADDARFKIVGGHRPPLQLTGSRRIRGIWEARAAAAVPILFDSVAPGLITVHGRHIPEKAAVGTISEQMAPDLNAVARLHVLALDPHFCEPSIARCLQGPDHRLTFIILHFDV